MQVTLKLDELDATAWNRAVAVRQRDRIDGECILPDSDSDLAGTILGEICRDWLEARDEWQWAKPS
jgi:hypothetical protein